MIDTNGGKGDKSRLESNPTSFEANFYWNNSRHEVLSITRQMYLFEPDEDRLAISTDLGNKTIGFLFFTRFDDENN